MVCRTYRQQALAPLPIQALHLQMHFLELHLEFRLALMRHRSCTPNVNSVQSVRQKTTPKGRRAPRARACANEHPQRDQKHRGRRCGDAAGSEGNGGNGSERAGAGGPTIQEILSRNVEFFSLNGNWRRGARGGDRWEEQARATAAMSSCLGQHHPIPSPLHN